MVLAPIVLFVYNRVDHTKKTIEALKQNELAIHSNLIIFSDAPKSEMGAEKVLSVRTFLKTIEGFHSITIIEREKNYGLAKSIIEGVSDIVNKYGKIIVLEDDLVTSTKFLKFMNQALDLYENDLEVISITGYTYPIKNLPQTFFLKGADCWSWATWKRGWVLFEIDGKKLLDELETKNLTKDFDFNRSYQYTQMLRDQIEGKNNSWAIRWYASAYLKNKLTLYPGNAFIFNIGNDASGTNTGDTHGYDTKLSNEEFQLKKVEIKEDFIAKKKFERFFRLQGSFLFKAKNRLIRDLKKLI